MSNTVRNYEVAKELYAQYGVDVDLAVAELERIPVSLHCWQADDVTGFENFSGGLTGGIQATGNYPGKARTPDEVRSDLSQALSYIPGTNKVNIHACYLETEGKSVDRDAIEPKHFENWLHWAKERGIGLDFNPTYFSHPKSADGNSMSHADPSIRAFWVEHTKRCRAIADYFGRETGVLCINNIWAQDGDKEVPIDSLAPRQRLKASLDEALGEKWTHEVDAVESKLFGIGSECYVVGSHEFYLGYAIQNGDVLLTMDAGHYHPTEKVSAKLSSALMFVNKGILLHVSRPERWDSDHVVAFDDETRAIMREIVRLNALDRIHIATDYFDASINRIIAMAVGARNTKKALLEALLQPVELLKKAELDGDRSVRLALSEELKTMPLNLVWDYVCEKNGVLTGEAWIKDAKGYEKRVLSGRG